MLLRQRSRRGILGKPDILLHGLKQVGLARKPLYHLPLGVPCRRGVVRSRDSRNGRGHDARKQVNHFVNCTLLNDFAPQRMYVVVYSDMSNRRK